MGKKASWPLLLLAGFVGWAIGSYEPEKPDAPVNNSSVARPGMTVAPKSNRVVAVPEPRPSPIPKTTATPKPPQNLVPADPVQSVVMYVDADRLNVRNGPGTENKQVWTLKRDEGVRIIAKSGDWRKVKGDRFEGWVHGGYLTPKKSPPKPVALAPEPTQPVSGPSDAQIRKALIQRSIALYRGSCPCPYNITRSGSRCGGRSAYSRPGGASPLCYDRDITPSMIAAFRARQ